MSYSTLASPGVLTINNFIQIGGKTASCRLAIEYDFLVPLEAVLWKGVASTPEYRAITFLLDRGLVNSWLLRMLESAN